MESLLTTLQTNTQPHAHTAVQERDRDADTRAIYFCWIAICILIAFWLRTYRLELQSLWYDEGVTVDIAQRTLPDLTRWTANDIQPPLYYYVVSGWGKLLQMLSVSDVNLSSLAPAQQSLPTIWGGAWSEWSVRFVSVIFGTLTIPLMASLAIRISHKRLAGAIAALLAALHPLLFYYSQEARMYAMLTFLGMLAGYAIFGGPPKRVEGQQFSDQGGQYLSTSNDTRWGLYIGIATASVYTHYFAFFLLGALALGYLVHPHLGLADPKVAPDKQVTGFREKLAQVISAHITILILYTPWFVALFTQLSEDSSYWQGSFKLNEAIRHVTISFVGGETVTEEIGLWLLVPLGLLTITSIIVLFRLPTANYHAPTTEHSLLTLLLWWLVPTSAILLLAIFIPKFNPRYAMLGLPGLILLWSTGLANILAPSNNFHKRIFRLRLRSAIALFAALLLLGTIVIFAYADRNYFVEPEFTKTQWRSLARYVRKRIPPEDLVVLTSGHTWPIWNYYAPRVPAVSVPEMRILDVNNVLDYPAAAAHLRNALVNRQGAWLISWQDEVVDPTDVVPLLLERAGKEVPSERNYWDISLQRFEQLDSSKLRVNLGTATNINYGSQLILRGFDIHDTGELLLYWQRHPDYSPPLSDVDLRVAGQLQTPEGLVYASFEEQPLTIDEWPTVHWHSNQLVVSRIPAVVWADEGAVPGDYGLQLGLYDPAGDLGGYDIWSESGQPMGKQRTLPVRVAMPTNGRMAEPHDMITELQPYLYASFKIEKAEIEPGQSIPIEIEWLVTEELDTRQRDEGLSIQLWWQNSSGDTITEDEISIADGYPLTLWPTGQILRSLHRLQTNADLPPDLYTLMVSAIDIPRSVKANVSIANVNVLPSTRVFLTPELAQPIGAEFGGEIALRGLLEALTLRPKAQSESKIEFTAVWQAIDPPQRDYSVSFQLWNKSNVPVSQVDLKLPGGSSSWLSEQVETQQIELTIPPDVVDPRLVAVVYDASTAGFARLHRQDGTDFVIINQ